MMELRDTISETGMFLSIKLRFWETLLFLLWFFILILDLKLEEYRGFNFFWGLVKLRWD